MVKFMHVVTALIKRANASRLLYAVPRDRNGLIGQEVLVSRVESRRTGVERFAERTDETVMLVFRKHGPGRR